MTDIEDIEWEFDLVTVTGIKTKGTKYWEFEAHLDIHGVLDEDSIRPTGGGCIDEI